MFTKLLKKKPKKNSFLFFLVPLFLGFCTSFSLPPYNYTFINFITFAYLLFFLLLAKKAKCDYKTFFFIGWFFGLSFFLASLYWISISLTHDDSFKVLIPFYLIIIPSFLSIFFGIATLILKKFVKPEISFILIFSLVFAIMEYLRGNILGGFPWNLFAYSWSWSITSIQFIQNLGTYGLNLLSITIFSFPFIFFIKIKRKNISRSLILVLVLTGSIFTYGLTISKNTSYLKNDAITLKIISPNIQLSEFLNSENDTKIIDQLIKLSNPKKEVKTIFVWPEGMFSSTYLHEIEKYKHIFSENFSENHIIIFGINEFEHVDNRKHVYNSLAVVDGNLNLLAVYKKNKLVPFGEFLPYENFFHKLGLKKITYGYKSFSKGKNRQIINIKNNIHNFSFLPLICYEIIYSGQLKEKKQKFDFIINISEDGWFGNSIGPYQHFTHAIYRAIEEGTYVIRSTNNGISAVVLPNGEIINSLKSNEKGAIQVEIKKNEKETIFSKFGNKIFFFIILVYTFLILVLKTKENPNE